MKRETTRRTSPGAPTPADRFQTGSMSANDRRGEKPHRRHDLGLDSQGRESAPLTKYTRLDGPHELSEQDLRSMASPPRDWDDGERPVYGVAAQYGHFTTADPTCPRVRDGWLVMYLTADGEGVFEGRTLCDLDALPRARPVSESLLSPAGKTARTFDDALSNHPEVDK